jgi:hypothetical protein
LNTECLTEQQIKELCAKHGFTYEDKIKSIIYPYCPSWTVINIEFEFQHHKMVRLYFMKYVFDKKVGVKTKSSGLVKRICGLTCEAFEKYLEEYIIQYKKVKITERKFFMNGDFYERADTE